jgi:hypothetical protein
MVKSEPANAVEDKIVEMVVGENREPDEEIGYRMASAPKFECRV